MGRIKLLSELIKAVGKKNKKTLKNTKPTTIKGINIKTKAGKRFGEKVKNQPKRIAGQKPVGMRDDLPADIDKPSFLKKRSIASSSRDKAVADRKMDIKRQIAKERVFFKQRDRTKAINEAFAKALNEKDPRKARRMLEDIKKMKDGGGFPDLSGDGKTTMKDILIGRGVIEKKNGGLIEATNKLKAQGLKVGGPPKKDRKPRPFGKKEKKPFVEGQDDFLNIKKRPEPFRKINKFTSGGPVRGKARGMGAATKGGGYNV